MKIRLLGGIKMIVIVGAVEYKVSFIKQVSFRDIDGNSEFTCKGTPIRCIDTMCEIRQLNAPNDSTCVATAWAFQSPRDRYSKLKGKKISLSRALKESSLPRSKRKIFWNQFTKEFESLLRKK